MLKGKVIELDNGAAYCVIEEINYDEKKYILAAPTDFANDDMNIDELVVKQIIKVDDSLEIVDVENDDEAKRITQILITNAHKNA